MENKKGKGIFLGVVSIATLIVAIIGATFAYFSATITGSGTVDATAYEFNASFSISPIYPATAKALIPLNPTATVTGYNTGNNNGTNLLYAINEAETKCVDSEGYQVCSVYAVTFTNNGTGAIELDGVLKTTANNASATVVEGEESARTPFQHLKVVELGGAKAEDDVLNTFSLGTTLDVPATVGNTVPLSSQTVPAGESKTIYLALYLNEEAEDNNPEMGASYTGELVYTAAGGQTLTGTFKLS